VFVCVHVFVVSCVWRSWSVSMLRRHHR